MEFLLGFVLATLSLFLFRNILKNPELSSIPQIRYSQSHVHEIIKDYIPDPMFDIKKPDSQSSNYEKSLYVKVVFIDNEAYWIKNNSLFVADMEEGIVAEETTRKVDTIGMDRVQLEKVIYIVDALTEGRNNDSGYTGDTRF
jgi:hypothetical protein